MAFICSVLESAGYFLRDEILKNARERELLSAAIISFFFRSRNRNLDRFSARNYFLSAQE